MKKKSRLLSLIFSIALVLVMSATGVSAEEPTSVAKIGDTAYGTLESAFSAAVSGDTITLTNDATVSALIEIKSSQNITLDLAEHMISGSMSSRMFAVSGTLTITGSGTIINTGSSNAISNGGTLIIESGAITASSAYAIYNTGTLTVNGGTITGGSSGTGYALYIAGGTVTINGGTFTSTNAGVGAVRNNGTLTINAGTVGNTTSDIYGVYNAGTVTVNGGTLSGSTAGLINTTSGSEATVYDGSLQGGKRGLYNSTGTATIYGGSFSGSEYGLMTNSPDTNTSTVYAGTFHGNSRAIIGYLTSTIADGSYFESGSYDQTDCVVAVGVTLGVGSGDTTVRGSLASNAGESTMYVKVSESKIRTYSTDAYPTTNLTFTDDSNETHNYIFAGWYSMEDDGSFTAMTSFPDSDAYAKFVDADALTVKCVFTYNVPDYGNIWRMLTSLDSLNYKGVYFTISANASTVTTTTATTKAYTTYEITGVATTFKPIDFSSVSNYVVTDYYADNGKTLATCVVAASWVTCDGTTVTGPAATFTASDNTAVLTAQ